MNTRCTTECKLSMLANYIKSHCKLAFVEWDKEPITGEYSILVEFRLYDLKLLYIVDMETIDNIPYYELTYKYIKIIERDILSNFML